MKNLKSLDLYNNQINKIDQIDNLVNLQFLDLTKNKIRVLDKSNIGNLPSLKVLILDSNYIKNCSFITKLTQICYFSIQFNKLVDFQSIEKLSEMEMLEEVFFIGNQLTKLNNYRINVFRNLPGIKKLDGKVNFL